MFQDVSEIRSLATVGTMPRRLLPIVVIFLFLYGAANLVVLGQKAPRASEVEAPKPNPPSPGPRGGYRGDRRRGPRPAASGASLSALEQSDNFVELGYQFFDKSRWRAAEVAYTEATTLWSGNADAWLALGELYITKGLLGDAYRPYNRLLSLDTKMAAYLLAEIEAKKKSSLNASP